MHHQLREFDRVSQVMIMSLCYMCELICLIKYFVGKVVNVSE